MSNEAYLDQLNDFKKTCKIKKYFSIDYKKVIKTAIKMIKKNPELISNLEIIDDPGHNFDKYQILVEKSKKNEYSDKYRMLNKDTDCKIEIKMKLNDSYFDYLGFYYPSKLRVSKNCDPDEVNFEMKHKIGGLFYKKKKSWLFSEFTWKKPDLDALQILSELIFNAYTNNNNKIISKLNENKGLIKSFTKFYKPYYHEIYDVPFIYVASNDINQMVIESAINNVGNFGYILNLLDIFKNFNEFLING
ncbi:MAG: hypothetical protein GF329_02570 [Candidatus Lokiarchaeota archaeon]|nr:hypothetical protein [Candidatus Lokiarchaeota archaeon]